MASANRFIESIRGCICVQRVALFIFLSITTVHCLVSKSWSYNHQNEWVTSYPQCEGALQSPVGLSYGVAVINSLPLPVFAQKGCKDWTQLSTRSAFEVLFEDCSSIHMKYQGDEYILEQMHFHSPSEHTIGSGYFAAEIHMLHTSMKSGRRLAIGIFLSAANEDFIPDNSALELLWNGGGDNVTQGIENHLRSGVSFNPYAQLLPGSAARYMYNGSFTTPPCNETVQWMVFNDPVTISKRDLQMIRAATSAFPNDSAVAKNGNNNRYPTRPLNGRTVHYIPDEANAQCKTTGVITSKHYTSWPMTFAFVVSFITGFLCIVMITRVSSLEEKVKLLQEKGANAGTAMYELRNYGTAAEAPLLP